MLFEKEYIPRLEYQTNCVFLCGAACFQKPASCWLCPIIPGDLTLATFPSEQSEHSYHHPSIINPIRTWEPDGTQCRLTFLSSLGPTSRAVTCTVFQVKVLLSQREAAPPVCEEGGRALTKNAETCTPAPSTQAFHYVLSERRNGEMSTQHCAACAMGGLHKKNHNLKTVCVCLLWFS